MSKRPDPFLKRAHHLWSLDFSEDNKPLVVRARGEVDYAMRALTAGPGAGTVDTPDKFEAKTAQTLPYLVQPERTPLQAEQERVEQYRLMRAAGTDVDFSSVSDNHVVAAVCLALSEKAPNQWTSFTATLTPLAWAGVTKVARASGVDAAADHALLLSLGHRRMATIGRRSGFNRKASPQVVLVKDLPEPLQRALKQVGYGRRDIAVKPASSYYASSGSSGDGYKAFTIPVDLSTGQFKIMWGSWGGANMFNLHNQVDLDDKARPMPPNGAVISGQIGGGRPVYATIDVHPDNLQKLLPSGGQVELSADEMKALNAIGGLLSKARADEFEYNNLGKYGPQNPLLQSLAQKGLIKISPSGIAITTAGKSMRLQRRAQEQEQVLVIRIKPNGLASVKPVEDSSSMGSISDAVDDQSDEPMESDGSMDESIDSEQSDSEQSDSAPKVHELFDVPLDALQPLIDSLGFDDESNEAEAESEPDESNIGESDEAESDEEPMTQSEFDDTDPLMLRPFDEGEGDSEGDSEGDEGNSDESDESQDFELDPSMFDLYNDVVRGLQQLLDQARGLRRQMTRSAADPMEDSGIGTIVRVVQTFDPVLMNQAGLRLPANTMLRVVGAHLPEADGAYAGHRLNVPGTRIRLALLDSRYSGRELVPGYPFFLVTPSEFQRYFKRANAPVQPQDEEDAVPEMPGEPVPLKSVPPAAPARANPGAQTNAARPNAFSFGTAPTQIKTPKKAGYDAEEVMPNKPLDPNPKAPDRVELIKKILELEGVLKSNHPKLKRPGVRTELESRLEKLKAQLAKAPITAAEHKPNDEENCDAHYCDNQGVCHNCGKLMDADKYDAYFGEGEYEKEKARRKKACHYHK